MEKEKYELVLAEHPSGYVFGCAKCRKILQEGTWAVGLLIGSHRYMVGHSPPMQCCDEDKKVGQVFAAQEEARILSDQVEEILNREGTTENLVLYEFGIVQSTAVH